MKSLGIKEQVAHHPTTSRSKLVSRRWMDEVTWRINQLSKWLAKGVISHLSLDQPYLGDLLTIVINHLLSGTILQAYFFPQSVTTPRNPSNKPTQEKKKKQLEDYIKQNKGISAITWRCLSQKKRPVQQDEFIEFTRFRKVVWQVLFFLHLMSWVFLFLGAMQV